MNRLGFRLGMAAGRMMRGPASVLAWAGMAGAAGLLSLWLGFTVLVLLFMVTGLRQQAAGAKAASTETRLNSLWVATGGVKDTADTAQSTANTANTNASNAQTTANAALPKAGGTITGGVTVNNTVNAGQVLGGWTSSSASVAGTNAHFSSTVQGDGDINGGGTVRGSGMHSSGDVQADGTVYGGSLNGNWAGGYGHSSGGFQVDGQLNCGSISISSMGAVAHPDANVTSLKQAVDGILNRL